MLELALPRSPRIELSGGKRPGWTARDADVHTRRARDLGRHGLILADLLTRMGLSWRPSSTAIEGAASRAAPGELVGRIGVRTATGISL